MSAKFFITSCFALSCIVSIAASASLPPGFSEKRLAHNLRSPSGLAVMPDSRLLILQQEGVVRIVKGDTLLPQPFFTVPNMNFQGERGLMGVALDPGFDTTGHIYLFHTAATPTLHNRVIRVTAVGDTADAASLEVVIEFPTLAFRSGTNHAIWHMGGGIEFGADGKLYVALGDHESPATAPNLQSVFGKVLRFNPDGSIPEDNPYYNTASGQNRAIWARGLRSPFTMAMKRGTNKLYVADVGSNQWEEVNEIVREGHYAWHIWEGPVEATEYVDPVYAYQRGDGCAVIGGDFYVPDSVRFPPWFTGHYFVTDFCQGWIRRINPETGTVTDFAHGLSYPTGLRFGRDGNMYYILRDHNTGNIQTRGMAFRVTSDSLWPATEPVPDTTTPPDTTIVPPDTTGTGLHALAGARDSRARAGLLAKLEGGHVLTVPHDARGIRVTDLSGRVVWAARNLEPGSRLELPAHLSRGVLRYRWIP